MIFAVVSEELGAHVLQLPYKGDDVSMFIFLPPFARARGQAQANTADRDNIRQVIERMTTTELGIQELQDILNDGMAPREVEVSIPKFSIEKELPVGQLLDAIGVGDLMKVGSANLRGFVDDPEGLHLGDRRAHV